MFFGDIRVHELIAPYLLQLPRNVSASGVLGPPDGGVSFPGPRGKTGRASSGAGGRPIRLVSSTVPAHPNLQPEPAHQTKLRLCINTPYFVPSDPT